MHPSALVSSLSIAVISMLRTLVDRRRGMVSQSNEAPQRREHVRKLCLVGSGLSTPYKLFNAKSEVPNQTWTVW